jgi:alcohol oxidase
VSQDPVSIARLIDAGDAKKLQKAGVKPIVDLPGVGLNFQDHYLTFSVYRAKPETESFDDFVRGDPDVQKRMPPCLFRPGCD